MLRELKGGPSTHKGQKRYKRRRVLSTVIITLATIMVVGAILIAVYLWYQGQQADVKVTDPAPKVTNVIKEPVPIAKNQKTGVYITELTSPITAGSNATASIRTLPQAACSIEVIYDNLKSTDTGLMPKTADEYGVVRWSWKVEQGQPVGKWPVNITCALNGSSGYMRGELVIQR
ncbi:hypothetical protein IPM09_05275 [Candidatus Saccharibacteria bacterium]|nr:MAG: hypothetical protein IPM09_05275 [Candidatus Saccharibacteria bacterium]